MKDPKGNSYRQIWMMGAAMTIPMVMISGPLAGYLFGHYILREKFNGPPFFTGACVFLGFLSSTVYIYQILQRMKKQGR